jgi:hypothetical protein
MTPKEKAQDLFEEIDNCLTYLESRTKVKLLANIMIKKLIDCTPSVDIYPHNFQSIHPRVKEYWKEVKQEIEKL